MALALALDLGVRPRLERLVQEEPYANGLAVIASNDYVYCPKSSYAKLQGTRTDFMSMDDAFMELNFARFPIQNGSSLVLASVMRVVASFQDYPGSYRNFAFVFSGHGSGDGGIVMQDGEKISIEDLIEFLQPRTAPRIAHWPKMYFIDACRGRTDMHSVLSAKGGQPLPHLCIPAEGNMLIAFSTAPRCRAYDRKAEGGCWLPFLARKLKEMDASVTDVLTAVNEEVFACFQEYSGRKIQQPHFESTLHRNVFLLREAVAAKAERALVQQRATGTTQEGTSASTSQVSANMGTPTTNSLAHVRKPSTDPQLQLPSSAPGCVTAHATPTLSGTTPKSFDTGIPGVIPDLGTRCFGGPPPMVELKNLVQDKLKLSAPDYSEVEDRKNRKNQWMYCCTVKHPLIPGSQVQGTWCNSKRLAKQDAANKALELIYEQYGKM